MGKNLKKNFTKKLSILQKILNLCQINYYFLTNKIYFTKKLLSSKN